MKKKVQKLVILLFFSFAVAGMLYAKENVHDPGTEQSAEFTEDIDSLFEDTSDTGAIVTPVSAKPVECESEKKKGIIFTGSLDPRLGGYVWFNPYDVLPAAVFESKVSFKSRPIDSFSMNGTLLVSFPQMQLGLYELYFTYSIFDIAFITAGKKEFQWGNSRMFDTNILDDKNDYKYSAEEILYDNPLDINKSKFSVMMSIPFWKFNLVGLVTHYKYDDKVEWSNYSYSDFINDLSYAAKFEANLWNVSFDIFWKYWANNDSHGFDPAFGADLNFQLGDFHFYTQFFTHFNNRTEKITFPRTKGTASIWWYTQEKVNLGFCLEYQCIYDWYGYGTTEPLEPGEYFKQYLAFEGVWGRICGSQFSLVLKSLHNFYERKGTVVPGVKIHDLFPCADLDFGIPVNYGSDSNIGIAIQLKLNINF